MKDFEKIVKEVLQKEDEFNNNYTKNCELAEYKKLTEKNKKKQEK